MGRQSRKRKARPKSAPPAQSSSPGKSVSLWGRKWLWVAGAVLAVAVILAIRLLAPAGHGDADLRAALIDQLSPAFPNEEFRSSVMADLEILGLPVDLYEGEEVDVDLYRALGEEAYGVLVIRSHSGTLELGGGPDQRTTALFTNESYSGSRHIAEQVVERVLIVRPLEDDPDLTFGVAPDFFRQSMRGELPHTIVVIAGCSILDRTDLAEALVSRGASVVISWDLSVALDHVDEGNRLLIHYLLAEGMTVDDAVAAAMDEAGPDPEFGAVLKYYPDAAGPYTAEQLLRR